MKNRFGGIVIGCIIKKDNINPIKLVSGQIKNDLYSLKRETGANDKNKCFCSGLFCNYWILFVNNCINILNDCFSLRNEF